MDTAVRIAGSSERSLYRRVGKKEVMMDLVSRVGNLVRNERMRFTVSLGRSQSL